MQMLVICITLIIAAVILSIFLLNNICIKAKASDKSHDEPDSKSQSVAFRRVYLINGGWDAEERQHRKKESRIWNKYLVVYVVTLVFTFIAAVSTYLAYRQTAMQAEIAQDQLSLNRPPIIKIFSLHVWTKGHGSPLGLNNEILPFREGDIIDGTAIAINVGPSTAFDVHSDLFFQLRSKPVGMNYPGWHLERSKLKYFSSHPPYDTDGNDIRELASGKQARWANSVTIPKNPESMTLYAFGDVVYRDRFGTQHGIYFSKKYDPTKDDFVSAENAKDGILAEY